MRPMAMMIAIPTMTVVVEWEYTRFSTAYSHDKSDYDTENNYYNCNEEVLD